MKISTITGTLTLLLVGCMALVILLPAMHKYAIETTLPIGAVAGVSVGGVVEPTPINTLYGELEKQKAQLDNKSQEISARQEYMDRANKINMRTLYVAIVLLFGLVLTNFYFDLHRNKQQTT